MKIYIVSNKMGMAVKAFASQKKAENLSRFKDGWAVDEVEVDQELDPTELVGPPETISFLATVKMSRKFAGWPPGEEPVKFFQGAYKSQLEKVFGPGALSNWISWETLDQEGRRVSSGIL